MKIPKSLLLGFTTSAIALTANPGFSESTPNNSPGFHCDTINNVLTTAAFPGDPKEKPISLIVWNKDYIKDIESKGDLSESCKKAANILNERYRDKKPNVAVLDSSKGSTVFCLVAKRNESCAVSGEKLFTFKETVTKENIHAAFTATIQTDLAEIDKDTLEAVFKGNNQNFPRMRPRSFWEKMFGI
jgi:hypothetical protein